MTLINADYIMSYSVIWTCSQIEYHKVICSRSLFTFVPAYSNLDNWYLIQGYIKTVAEQNYQGTMQLESNGTTVKATSAIINTGQNDGAGRIEWPDLPVDENTTFKSHWIKKGINKLQVDRIDLRVTIIPRYS